MYDLLTAQFFKGEVWCAAFLPAGKSDLPLERVKTLISYLEDTTPGLDNLDLQIVGVVRSGWSSPVVRSGLHGIGSGWPSVVCFRELHLVSSC